MDGLEGAVLETPIEQTETVETPVEQEVAGVPGEELSQETEQVEEKQDGRTLPKNVQGALKTLKEAHPELAKEIDELRKGYFGHRQHSEFFKSPTEARQAKATLDLIGGSEGIANLQSKVAAVEMVDSAFEQGDPQVIEDISADFPDGFKKLMGPALDKLQKLDAGAYAQTIQPHTFAAMDQAGLGSVLQSLVEAVNSNDLAKAKELLGKTYQWYEGQRQQAGNRTKGEDPERQKFEQERQKFQQEREQTFREDIGRQTVGHQGEQINKALVPYLKMKNLSAEAKSDLMEGCNTEINRLLRADQAYQTQVKAMLAAKSRDSGQIVRYINAAVDEAATKAVKAVWTRRYGAGAPARPATPQAGKPTQAPAPSNSAPVKVAAKPKTSEIVKDRGWDLNFMKNRAVMATGPLKGKLVTW